MTNETEKDLRGQIESLKFALSMVDGTEGASKFWRERAEMLAAENGHLMAALAELSDSRAHSLPVLLEFYSTSGVLLKSVQGYGYLAAVEDVKKAARKTANPAVYDLLMSMAGHMEKTARAAIIEPRS
jgi:hypothetical protein